MSETAEKSQETVSATTEPLSEPLTIGVEAYLSQEYARAERDKLWAKVWRQVGRVEELPQIGDFLTYEIGDDSLIVVRTAAEEIRAYYNVCSHRGRRLIDTPFGAKNVDAVVSDASTAEALKAYYRFLCKRPCFSDEYLPTFNRPNVTLVDVSDTKGVERITAHGIVAHGTEHEVDCIIFASGFEITTELDRRLGIAPFAGRDGLSLYDHLAKGYRTLHGVTSCGFPNLFWTGFI